MMLKVHYCRNSVCRVVPTENWLLIDLVCFSSDFSVHFNFHAKKSCAIVQTCRELVSMRHMMYTYRTLYAKLNWASKSEWKNMCKCERMMIEVSIEWKREKEWSKSMWKAILGCLVRLINNPIVNYNRQQWQSAELFPWTHECLLLLIVSFCLQQWKCQPRSARYLYLSMCVYVSLPQNFVHLTLENILFRDNSPIWWVRCMLLVRCLRKNGKTMYIRECVYVCDCAIVWVCP